MKALQALFQGIFVINVPFRSLLGKHLVSTYCMPRPVYGLERRKRVLPLSGHLHWCWQDGGRGLDSQMGEGAPGPTKDPSG